MLNVSGLSISFQGETLFSDVAFMLVGGDRVGIIGKNGAGKSTLLKMLSGELPPDTGTIALERNTKIGYLKQDIDFVAGRTVLEEAYQAFTTLMRLEEELDSIHHEIATRTDYESESYNDLLIRLHDVTHEYEIHGGYTYKGDTERILSGLGFSREDFSRLTDSFSGGWRMRIELAKLLLEKNDILLLDEPTNHLDIESIIWFEGFLKSFPGAVVIISHDKMFLDNVTNRTIEIVAGRIYDYPKPYSAFLELRKEMITQQLAAQKNQEKMIQQTEKLIDKFRAKASKASMAQSLIKKLDRIERIEVDEQETAVMSVRFPLSQQPGKVVLEIDHVSKSYDDKLILKDVSLLVERGSKIAFVGQNGQGKTTLAKMMVHFYAPNQGDICLGGVNLNQLDKQALRQYINYLPQQPYVFNGTILENLLLGAHEGTTQEDILRAVELAEIRSDIERMPLNYQTELSADGAGISGGQRQRIALARALLTDAPVLILDEATSSLDILTEKRIIDNLMALDKTIIFIAHRLTIAERSEQVVVLDQGRIVESGSHKELIEREGFYHHLVNS